MIKLLETNVDNTVMKKVSSILTDVNIWKEKYNNMFINKVKNKYNFLPYWLLYNSCSNALIATILALWITKNSEVIIPTYTCKSILDVLVLLWLKPVLVDCYLDYKKWNFNPDKKHIINQVSQKTKLIIIPYNFWYISEYNELYNLWIPIIEDITLVFWARLLNNINYNRIIISSFHKSKVLSSIEWWIVLTNNIYYRFIIWVKENKAIFLLKYLLDNWIEGWRWIYPLISDYINSSEKFVNAEKVINTSVSIPIYSSLTDNDVQYLIYILNNYKW